MCHPHHVTFVQVLSRVNGCKLTGTSANRILHKLDTAASAGDLKLPVPTFCRPGDKTLKHQQQLCRATVTRQAEQS